MKDTLIQLVSEVSGYEPGEVVSSLDFFEDGILDSFGVVHLLVKIEEAFSSRINIAEIVRDDINTLDKLLTMVKNNI